MDLTLIYCHIYFSKLIYYRNLSFKTNVNAIFEFRATNACEIRSKYTIMKTILTFVIKLAYLENQTQEHDSVRIIVSMWWFLYPYEWGTPEENHSVKLLLHMKEEIILVHYISINLPVRLQ